MEERGYAGLYTGATWSSLGSGLMHTSAAVCARTRQCYAITDAPLCPLTVLFAEAFHGWTTGTLVWRQRCDFDLNLWRTGGIANDKLKEKSMKVTTISHTCGGEYQGEKRKPKANISKNLKRLEGLSVKESLV